MSEITVTVFGSSQPKPDSLDYISAYKLGLNLAKFNLNVCTGGYFGIMEAVSKGANEGGVKVTGVTLPVFGGKPNRFITDEIGCTSLFERVEKLISIGDAFVIYPGGTGTLVELAFVWELLNKGLMYDKPVTVVGGFWDEFVNFVDKRMEFEKRQTGLVKICTDEIEAINYLKKEFSL
ncbi:MAG: cytokinin riboside 5'-monophosphate phosphoribohydrolase [Melioribacteraceae bacterium]|nr:MAG: cytokinin riboside 5'-monophosphate phosphoribohydrolase [Melioribacteraceae bacterium]